MRAVGCVCPGRLPGDMCKLIHATHQAGKLVLELSPRGMAGTGVSPGWGSVAQLQQPESPIQPSSEWAWSQAKDGDAAKRLMKVSGGG